MFLSAHQPVYLPWLGLFHKIAVADTFAVFDVVPYSRKMFYNRNSIYGPNGPLMLSVPVLFSQKDATLHKDVEIDRSKPWQQKHWRSIVHTYTKAQYFEDYAGGLEEIYQQDWQHLAKLNAAILNYLLSCLKIETPVRNASDFDVNGSKSDLIIDLCSAIGADVYLFGALGRDYAETEQFLAAGIAPLFQDYVHPQYAQIGNKPFQSHLSVLDLLFREGPKSRDILMDGNATREWYLDQANQLRGTGSAD